MNNDNKKAIDPGEIYPVGMNYGYDLDEVTPNYQAPIDDYPFVEHYTPEPKKCECGSEAAGLGGHSTWCPKFVEMK